MAMTTRPNWTFGSPEARPNLAPQKGSQTQPIALPSVLSGDAPSGLPDREEASRALPGNIVEQEAASVKRASTPRIVVVSRETLFAEGLARILQSQIQAEMSGVFGTATELLAMLDIIRPDLVLIDLALAGKSTLEITQMIREQYKSTRVIIVASMAFAAYAPEALEAGARGFVLKESTSRELGEAVLQVHRGHTFVSEAISKDLLYRFVQVGLQNKQGRRKGYLSIREEELLSLIAQGRSNSEIADALFISAKTVESHKRNMMSKLGLAKTTELLRYAVLRTMFREEAVT